MPMFSSGLVLAQHKEPALSQRLLSFVNPHIEEFRLPGAPLEGRDGSLPDTDALIRLAREAGVTDERDGSPLHEGMAEYRGSGALLIVDAVDDEPYVSSRLGPLLQLQEELLGGLGLLRYLCDAKGVYLIVYKHLTDIESHIPSRLGECPVVKLRGGYPASPTPSQIRKVSGMRRFIVGPGAVIRLYRAFRDNMREHTAFITVHGDCVAHPVNMEVSLGMPLSRVLERVGLLEEPGRIVSGGPMRGFAVLDAERTVVMPTTRAVLAFRRKKRAASAACTGCGRCEVVCPRGLNPAYIHRFVERSYYPQLYRFDPHLCIACGTCAYICPSRLNLAGSMEKAREMAEKRRVSLTGEEEQSHAQ